MLEDKMNNPFGDEAMDLGSNDFGGMFEDADLDKLFGSSDTPEKEATADVPEADNTPAESTTQESVPEETSQTQTVPEPQAEIKAQTEKTEEKNEETIAEPEEAAAPVQSTTAETDKLEDDSDIYASALANAEEKEVSGKKDSLIEKLPIFVYGKAKDEIVDTSTTFEALRLEKAEDFPELDDGENVSWKVTYGSISKNVTTPKDTTIASFKKKIEDSKEFPDAIKKAKGELKCEITPSVKAKKKGVMSAYKGLYETVDDARMSDKAISYVPSENGRLYEIRSNGVGTFIAQTRKATAFQKVRAGFIPALPKIPFSVLSEILAFFKSYITKDGTTEALAYIFWSKAEERYFVHIPKQEVSKASVDTNEMPLDDERFKETQTIELSDVDMTSGWDIQGYFDRIQKYFNLYRECLGNQSIETMAEKYISGMHAIGISAWGHHYFVPKAYMQGVSLLEDFLTLVADANLFTYANKRDSKHISMNAMFVVDNEEQCKKMTQEFYHDLGSQIAEYQRRIGKLIKSGNTNQKVLDRWVLKIQTLETKKKEYETILHRDLSGMDEEFAMLESMCQNYKMTVKRSQIFGVAA